MEGLVRVAFYFICHKCNLKDFGVSYIPRPEGKGWMEYSKACVKCDGPMMPQIEEDKGSV